MNVGDTVHYVSYGTPGGEYESECRAAIITQVGAWVTKDIQHRGDGRLLVQQYDENAMGLSVLNPTGIFLNQTIPYHHPAQGTKGGTWHGVEQCG